MEAVRNLVCQKHMKQSPWRWFRNNVRVNVEVFGKILPEKEPKLPKKVVFGLFFCAEIEQKILYVRYFFSNYVEFTVRTVFFF